MTTLEKELKQVLKLIKRDFPKAVDYNYINDDNIEILDKDDVRIATINEKRLTGYWNEIESA
jgi:hypothetical protein